MNAPPPAEPLAPPPRSVARSIYALMSARGAGLGLRIVASLIAASIAGPHAVGTVAWIGIFSTYVLWLTVGVQNGAERLVPIRRAAGEVATLPAVWGVTALVSLLATGVCVLLGAVGWGWEMAHGDHTQAWKFLCAGILAGTSLFVNYVTTVFTAENRIAFLGRLFFIEGILWWVFLPLAWGGTPGLTLRALVVALLPAVICLVQGRVFHRPAWDRAVAATLAREGLPILVSRFLLLLSFGLDRTLIAVCMDDLALGHYVLATSVISIMRLVQYALSRVLTPNLGEAFGRREPLRRLARTALQALPPLLVMLLPLAIAGWFLAEPLTRWLLPDYVAGVPAARLALISGVLIAMLGTNVFYVTIGRQKTVSAMLLVGLCVQTAVSLLLFRAHGTLESFVWGFVAGAATNNLLVNGGLLYYAFRPSPKPSR